MRKSTLAEQLSVGDTVIRTLAGSIQMGMEVTEITADAIHCGPWMFHPVTGGEIDEDLGWDGVKQTGSTITPKEKP